MICAFLFIEVLSCETPCVLGIVTNMSDLSDKSERASAREEQLRDDALAKMRQAQAKQAAKGETTQCDTCDDDIPAQRREALPYVRTCIACASKAEQLLKIQGRAV